MEKKLTDEVLKAKRKKILANRVYSDSTLKSWTKEDLIEQIRVLEHNWAVAEESLNNSVKNSEKIFYEQKAEIERLTEEKNELLDELIDKRGKMDKAQQEVYIYQDRNFELQRQVYELKELNAKYLDSIESLTAGKCVLRCELTKQAVKDTVKDLLIEFNEWINGQYDAKLDTYSIHIPVHEVNDFLTDKAKKHGVEVE